MSPLLGGKNPEPVPVSDIVSMHDILAKHGIDLARTEQAIYDERRRVRMVAEDAATRLEQERQFGQRTILTARQLVENGRVLVVVEGKPEANPSFTCPKCG